MLFVDRGTLFEAYIANMDCWPAARRLMQRSLHACRVRHEAGEALGAIGTSDCVAELRRHQEDPCLEVLSHACVQQSPNGLDHVRMCIVDHLTFTKLQSGRL